MVSVHRKDRDSGSRKSFTAVVAKRGADEEEDPAESTMVYCFEHVACAGVSEETVVSLGVFGKVESRVEAIGKELQLSGSKDGTGVLENGNVDEKGRLSGMGDAGNGEE